MIANRWANYTLDGTSNTGDNGLIQLTGSPAGIFTYDGAGNITYDGANWYLYDGEDRICAVKSQPIPGTCVMTQYLYDAEGHRVAKGSITTFSCDTNVNGFTNQAAYVISPAGEQLSELTWNAQAATWQAAHTNVYAAGMQIVTYDADPTGTTEGNLYFHISDWLGTRRQQTDYAGNPLLNFIGLPYGDGLSTNSIPPANAADATEHHFTGKERDTESGNDYFGARYYASTMGRMMSPDPHSGTLLHMLNPQRWNMYSYALNNPLFYVDPTGMDAIAVAFGNKAVHLGHVGIISVHSDGSARFGDFGPAGGPKPYGKGHVNDLPLDTKVDFGSDGRPTQASLNALREELAAKENEPDGTIGLVDFKTSDAEASNLDVFIDQAQRSKEWTTYHVGENFWDVDCRDYLREGLNAAGLHFTRAQFLRAPNNLFNWLSNQTDAKPLKEKVTHRICDENGKNCH